MKKILVIGGTADSSALIEAAPAELSLVVTTFSEQGKRAVPNRADTKVVCGALDEAGFSTLIAAEGVAAVADLSHPFAKEVSANAKSAAQAKNIPYFRYVRPGFHGGENRRDYPDFEAAADALKEIDGNILLTIGSRHLGPFLAAPELKNRCYMRVLADSRVLKELEDKEVDPAKIFAMKGVASRELNIALIREVNAKALVTKDSGSTGGLAEKAAAAAAMKIPFLVVGRPDAEEDAYDNIAALLAAIMTE